MSYEDAFYSLTDAEFAVVYWKCQGLTHDEVALKFREFNQFYGREWVQKRKSAADVKLGLSHLLQSERERVYERDVCPALTEWINQHKQVLDRLKPPLNPLLEPGAPPEKRKIQTVRDKSDDPEVVEGEEVDENDYEGQRQERARRGGEHAEQGPVRRARSDLRAIIIGVLLVAGVCVSLLWFGRNGILAAISPNPTGTPPNTAQSSSTTIISTTAPTSTSQRTPTTEPTLSSPTPGTPSTPEASQTPEEIVSTEFAPRAIPLPITEDFSHQYRDLWQTFGNPIVTDNLGVFGTFKGGLLTAEENQTAKIVIANTDWVNYIVSVQASMPFRNTEMLIGVRVRDINNMIALSYSSFTRFWTWVVIEEGVWDELPGGNEMYTQPVTITVDGDTFTAVGSYPGLEPKNMSFVLPLKYKNKYPRGGVLLQVTGQTEIDYIEVHPFQ